MGEVPFTVSPPDESEPLSLLTPPSSMPHTRRHNSYQKTHHPFLSEWDSSTHLLPGHTEFPPDNSSLPILAIQAIEGEQQFENEVDCAGSGFISEDDFSDFQTIETVSDLGLSYYLPRQVRKYSIPEVKALQSADSPIQGPSYQEGSSHASSPDGTSQAGIHLFPDDGAARATEEDFDTNLDTDLQEEFSVENVREKLYAAQTRSAYGSEKHEYLPHDALLTILHELAIYYVLAETFGKDCAERFGKVCNQSHRLSRRMILAILIMVGRVECIDDFIDSGIYDNDLPLRRESPGSRRFRKRRTKGPETDRLLKFPKKRWALMHLSKFCEAQYRVVTPFLHISNKKVCFYKMDPNIRLPFTEYTLEKQGGYGAIYQAKIHKSHHEFIASLTLHTPDYESYAKEVDVLQRFSGESKGHPHLIRLLMAFEHGERLNLVFPWASGNLFTLWKDNPLPEQSTETVRWLVNQCSGLAGGLAKVHRHDSWPFNNKGRRDQLGRHGDIKPLNILWFKTFKDDKKTHNNHLVIADFGLTIFHSSAGNTELTTANRLRGCSRTYRPPEVDLNDGPILQSYDVWSLACLYIEFITWYLLGFDKTTNETGGTEPVTFADYRISGDYTREDKFFIRRESGDPKLFDAVVKPEVKEWISQLRELDHCPQCLMDFLDFIQNRMLLPVAHQRADMRDVNLHLGKIKDRCNSSRPYCNSRGHSVFRDTLRDTEEVPATGKPRTSTVADGDTGDGASADTLEPAGRASDELDKAIYAQLLLQEYTLVEDTPVSDQEEGDKIPDTKHLSSTSAPIPGHERLSVENMNRRTGINHKIPHLLTDVTTSTFDESQLSTPPDSAVMTATPYTTHGSYEEMSAGVQHGYHGTAKLSPRASSVAAGSFLSPSISPDARRSSIPDTVPSQASTAESPATEKPKATVEKPGAVRTQPVGRKGGEEQDIGKER
ncbi:Homeodomain-interacting protein kinase 1 [Apiospora hydei]|uniref:Homeodomain-interacting protein kinase 1 n=1 Tax=Apiospora hydei TaxID=1337664 RepID=A0ABR1XA68_9PEZI